MIYNVPIFWSPCAIRPSFKILMSLVRVSGGHFQIIRILSYYSRLSDRRTKKCMKGIEVSLNFSSFYFCAKLLFFFHFFLAFLFWFALQHYMRSMTSNMSANANINVIVSKMRWDVRTWDPLVPGPELAIDTVNGRSCL